MNPLPHSVRPFLLLLAAFLCLHGIPARASVAAAEARSGKLVYSFPIREDIMPAVGRLSAKCMKEAQAMNADLILIELNTYGGLVNVADSIRTAVLNSPIPVWVFIDNQAASAGALIALAADSIYMRPGGSIGAASVVDNTGRPMPDKFQSFMRATMRATAEAHGKVAETIGTTDTLWRWHRDPGIAEAMVGVPSGDTLRVLTLTADEALSKHYCEGKATDTEELLEAAGITDYTLFRYTPSLLDRILGWLMNPVVQSMFIMLVVGGIYFELQTPGIGFPLIAALLGALLYFAPLYLEGITENWELVLFITGIVLLGIEIFALQGFGIAGIAGIIAIVISLSFAAIDNSLFRHISSGELSAAAVFSPVLTVIAGLSVGLLGSFWLGGRLLTKKSPLREKLVLTSSLSPDEGYTGHPQPDRGLIGRTATVSAVLRPAGRILIDGRHYDAVAENGFFIAPGETVTVTRIEGGQLYCRKKE